VTAVDASSEMVGALDVMAGRRPPDLTSRYTGRVALAAELPFDDAAFDLTMSSFVLQLVPDRPAVLREIHRVLRPGASLGYVTWLADRTPFPPDRVFDALLAEFGFEDEPEDERVGDVPSAAAATDELRRAGFSDVLAESAVLEHAFTVESYLTFLVEFDEESTFDEMGRTERRRFLARLREGLMRLPADDLVFRAPIVYATARR
jgi:SAM-dependent methyltransferase